MREHVHAGRVEVAEPRRAFLGLAIHEIERGVEEFLIHRLHALTVERAGVFNGLLADPAELRIDRRIILVGRLALEHAAGTVALAELRVLRVVLVLRLFLRVEVVEVAEELIEAVHRRQVLVAVPQMVLAELAGRVAESLHELPDGGILETQPQSRPRHADLGKPGADGRLPGNEGSATGGAALLPVEVREQRPLPGDAVDVGRAVAHHPEVVCTDVKPADVIGHDEENIWLLAARHCRFPVTGPPGETKDSSPKSVASPCQQIAANPAPGGRSSVNCDGRSGGAR